MERKRDEADAAARALGNLRFCPRGLGTGTSAAGSLVVSPLHYTKSSSSSLARCSPADEGMRCAIFPQRPAAVIISMKIK